MRAAGFQSLSLLDFPGRPCSIIFTQGCVFRCPYCHNPELIPKGEGLYSEEEILKRLRRHKKTVSAICITGSEPTLQSDLPSFLRTLKAEGFAIKLDTNGVHPRLVNELIHERLVDYFAMDLKHVWEKYGDATGVRVSQIIENCRKSFELIQESGIEHEFRTTIFPGKHDLEDFVAMAGYLRPRETYAVQSFHDGKTLVPNIPKATFDAETVIEMLRPKFPKLILLAR